MKWEEVGQFTVDSGTILLGNPCYLLNDEEINDWDDFIDEISNRDFTKSKFGIIISQDDGIYDVSVRRNEDGEIAEIRIELE